MRSQIRSVIKTVTWRMIGAADSFALSAAVTFWATGHVTFSQAGTFVGLEIITKSALYYLHERIWSHVVQTKQ